MTATLTGQLLNPDTGQPVAGHITLTPPTAIAYAGAVVTRTPIKIPVTAGAVHREGIVPGRYHLAVQPDDGDHWAFPTDLLEGVNDIEALQPAVTAPQPILRGEPGRGIVSVTDDDGDGTATITYTDDTTEQLPLPPGPPGQQIRLDADGVPYFTGV